MFILLCVVVVFFFNDTATTEIYTLSLHDALPIYGVRLFLEQQIIDHDLSNYAPQYLSLFFDIIKSNVSLNKSITDNSLQEELGKISSVRGSIEKGTLIISKGEVVEDRKSVV